MQDILELWWKELWVFVPRLVLGLGIFLAFWIGAKAGQSIVRRMAAARDVDPNLISLFGSIVSASLLVFGAVTALGTLSINVTALVAGLGLTGFAVGFALKDILSNAISGILLILYKPFHHGDQIAVTGFEGTVLEVNMRYTVLNTAEQKKVFLPNSNLFTNPVTVFPRTS
jgi:small-conductance mechanosensitive channel